jgi:hypothetical protein
MKRSLPLYILFAALLTLSISAAEAQDTISSLNSQPALSAKPKNPNSFWRRLSVGGQIGFQFGTVTGIVIAPDVKVRTFDQLYVGLRLMYQYYYYRDWYWDRNANEFLDYSSNVFGSGVYLRYYLRSLFSNFFGNFYAHVEYEYLFYTLPFVQEPPPKGYIEDPYGNWYVPGSQYIGINSFFVGGGYSQPLGGRAFLDFMVLFNLNDTQSSPYTNPIIRIGVGFGL